MVCGIVWSRIHSLDSREREPTHFSSKWESFERGGFSLKHFGKEGFGGGGVGGTVPAQREKFTCPSPGAQHPAFPSPSFPIPWVHFSFASTRHSPRSYFPLTSSPDSLKATICIWKSLVFCPKEGPLKPRVMSMLVCFPDPIFPSLTTLRLPFCLIVEHLGSLCTRTYLLICLLYIPQRLLSSFFRRRTQALDPSLQGCKACVFCP